MIGFLLKQIYIKRQFVKYIIGGCTAAIVDLLLLYVFTDIFGLWVIYSATLAFLVAFFVSFYIQKFWTFRDNRKKGAYKQMAMYFGVGTVNLGINAGGMFVLVERFGVPYILAQIVIGSLIAVSSFIIYRFVIFRKKTKEIKKESNREAKGGKINILIATGVFPPDIGGPATYAKNLRKEFKGMGHKVKVVTYGEKTYKNKSGDIFSINRNQNILTRYFKYFWKIYRLLDWADVFYTLDLVSAGLPSVLVAKLKNKKAIFRTGGDFLWEKSFQEGWTDLPLVEYYKEKKNLKEKFLLNFSRRVLRKFNLVIFSTNLQKDIYKKYYDIEDEKIKLVPNALPVIKIMKGDEQKKIILFAGRFIRLKNIERLIIAFSKLKSDAILHIYGKGPDKKKLKDLIKKMNQSERIMIMDSVFHNELIEKISESLFVILPSITEISPNLAIECISMGKPIILTKYTGIGELTANVITIDPLSENDIKEKIEYLSNDYNLRNYADKLKRVDIVKREWKDIAREHISIFNKILNNKNE